MSIRKGMISKALSTPVHLFSSKYRTPNVALYAALTGLNLERQVHICSIPKPTPHRSTHRTTAKALHAAVRVIPALLGPRRHPLFLYYLCPNIAFSLVERG